MKTKIKLGDIVVHNGGTSQYLVTSFGNGCWSIQCITGTLNEWRTYIHNEDEYEVIGNIFNKKNNKKEK